LSNLSNRVFDTALVDFDVTLLSVHLVGRISWLADDSYSSSSSSSWRHCRLLQAPRMSIAARRMSQINWPRYRLSRASIVAKSQYSYNLFTDRTMLIYYVE